VQARANTPARTTLAGLPILPKQEESIRREHRNGFGAEPKVVINPMKMGISLLSPLVNRFFPICLTKTEVLDND